MQTGFQTAEQNGNRPAPVEAQGDNSTAVEVYPIAEDADAILSQDTIKKQIVPVAPWRLSVEIRSLTIAQIEEITLDAQIADDTGAAKADGRQMNRLFVTRSVIRPKFTPDQVVKMFTEQSAEATGTVLEAIMRLNGLGASFGLSVASQVPATFQSQQQEST